MTRPRCLAVLTLLLTLACLAFTGADVRAAGVLVPRDGSAAIRVRSHRVTAVVEDGIARTTVRQTFVNPHGRALEAVYVFPIPEGAALVDLAMETGGQRLEGLLAERRTARRAYDSLVRRRIDPAIVEQVGRSTFRLSVFPVLPDQPTVVEMTWIERVPLVRGEMRYVYPLGEAGQATRTEEDLTVSVTMRSSATITEVASPVEGMAAALASPHEARASFERNGATLDRDVVVTAKVAAREPSLAVRTFRGASGDPFFAAVVTPPEIAEERVLPRDVTLVLDTSGSMGGEKIEQARASARFLLQHLRAKDRVNVLLFSTDVRRFDAAPVEASAENLTRLRAFVDEAVAAGGTALGDALRAATEAPAEPGRVAMVVLLTDGLPTLGVTAPGEIVAFAKAGAERGLRVFPFGVGADVNGTMLEAVAFAGRGASEVFRPQGEIETRMNAFLARTESPVLTNLRLTIDGRAADDVLPRPLPDLYLGEQAALAGRAKLSGTHEFVVRAVLDGKEIELRSKVDVPAQPGGAPAVRDLYARSRLEFLERAHRLRVGLADDAYFAALDRGSYSTADELVRAMIDLSLETGVQCPYTAFLALLPEDRARIDPRDAAEIERATERARAKSRELAGIRPAAAPTAGPAPAPAGGKEPPIPVREGLDVVDGEVFYQDEDDASENGDPDIGYVMGETGGTSIGVGVVGHRATGSPSAYSSRRAGAGGEGGGGLGQGGGGRGAASAGGLGQPGSGGYGGVMSAAAENPFLAWLTVSRSADGGWAADVPAEKVADRMASDPGTTGLVLLAFLGAGESHRSGTRREQVQDGLEFLRSLQDAEGCFSPQGSPDRFRDHLLATLALTESFRATRSEALRDPTSRAMDFAVSNLLPQKARTSEDVEVTAWAVLLVRSAREAGLVVDVVMDARLGVRLDAAADAKLGPADLALLGVARTLAKDFRDPRDAGGALAEFRPLLGLLDDDPSGILAAEPFRTLATLAAFRVGGEEWKRWTERARASRGAARIADKASPLLGSWPPVPGGLGAGRVRATALGALEMEVHDRYARVIGTR